MQEDVRYTVRPEKTTEVISSDPIELKSIPCWTVTRVTGGMGWHIGKYKTERAAQRVAVFLDAFSDDEVT
jgi:hypothetical protein